MAHSREARLQKATALLSGIILAVPAAVLACPSCKDAIAGDPVASALSWTTLVMIAVPLLLFGSIGGWVGYVYWRAARRDALASGAAPPPRRLLWHPLWTEKESET